MEILEIENKLNKKYRGITKFLSKNEGNQIVIHFTYSNPHSIYFLEDLGISKLSNFNDSDFGEIIRHIDFIVK